ncbi:MAG TPA: HEAT repeat domain-containing protein, partial [Terriglobia bacterium]|nr:HEAT repeat domain-containing protein [Terriglobia bacterium]
MKRNGLILAQILVLAAFAGATPRATAQSSASSSPQAAAPSQAVSGSDVEDLRNPKPKVRAKAAREIGENGDPSAVPALIAALNDPSPRVRKQVVVALASIRVKASLQGLIQATSDSDSEVRWLAVKGIEGYYTGVTPKTGFMGYLESQYRSAKRSFLGGPIRITPGTAVDPQAVAGLDRVMMDTRHQRAAQEATRALGMLMARQAVPNLVITAHGPSEDLAREALNSLGKIQDLSAGPKLVDLLSSPNRKIQRDAAVTVGILHTRAAVPKLQALYANGPDQETRQAALQGLAYIGDPVSVPMFLQALNDKEASIRGYAAQGLARAKDQKALPDLLRSAPAEKNADARLAMEFAITSLGRNDYLSSIIQSLDSGEADVAQAYLVELARNPNFLAQLYPYLNSRNAQVQ